MGTTREAEASLGCGYVGLLPRTHQQGNRQPKSPTDSSELLDKFIKEHFETPRQATGASVYRAYVRACTALNIQPLSNRTFYQRLKKRPTHEQTLKRQGAKAAYATEPFVWELALNTRPHGNRPLEIVHIDHTELDIELRSQATGRLLGRPWLTLLTDAYSRRILAVYLTFDAPSYRSCMMGLRILVQRQGRFPSTLVVDGGKEFHSIYFDTLLARYHCTKKTRPGGKPRFGSVIERLFGTTNTEFIYNLLGNTQASKQPRQLTKVVDPKQLAVWNLGGTGSNAGKLLDQLDWIKSMTNVTGVLHILIGTYELLNFRNLSGQASRRGLDIHFPRYLYQNEQDRLDFQAALLALLKQVPLDINIPELMQHWLYFYEHSIGCLGVLKDWLIRTVAAALDDGNVALTLKQLHEHTLTLAQCERMAIEATEGEQKLSYMESRREHLWHLLQIGMGSTDVPTSAVTPETPFVGSEITSAKAESPPKTKRTRKKPNVPAPQEFTTTTANEIPVEPAPKKKQTRKKTTSTQTLEITETPLSNSSTDLQTITQDTQQQTDNSREKKSGTRVGQRTPQARHCWA